jgi:hypothetical protein
LMVMHKCMDISSLSTLNCSPFLSYIQALHSIYTNLCSLPLPSEDTHSPLLTVSAKATLFKMPEIQIGICLLSHNLKGHNR